MFNFKKCTLKEFWEYVSSHLEKNGIGVTLVGGAVATVYSKGQYESGDLDMVFDSLFQDRGQFSLTLEKIGIKKIDQRNFKHPDCLFSIEAKLPPIEIGDMGRDGDQPEIVTQEAFSTKIKILSPTDCIKDRLYKADYYSDEEAFGAAVAVAKEVGFKLDKLKIFCEENKKTEILNKFLEKLKVT